MGQTGIPFHKVQVPPVIVENNSAATLFEGRPLDRVHLLSYVVHVCHAYAWEDLLLGFLIRQNYPFQNCKNSQHLARDQ